MIPPSPVLAAAILVAAGLTAASAAPVPFADSGATAADIEDVVEAYRAALDPFNPPDPVPGDPDGRRQIDWDAAPDFIADPNAFPGDFFNFPATPRARGIEFVPTDTDVADGLSSAEGFQLSSTLASGEPIEFGFEDEFTVFSPERLFAPTGGTVFEAQFFDPVTTDLPALSKGLGVIFTDNDYDTENAKLEYFGAGGTFLGSIEAPLSESGGLSFAGLIFDDPVVRKVVITSGTLGIDEDGIDSPLTDRVVMDDFIFGEPAAIPLPAGLVLLPTGLMALGALRRRRKTRS